MPEIDYFTIIHKYIPPDSATYKVYILHVTLVTAKALKIAKRLGLSSQQQRFIEEAAMLHDIGIIHVKGYSSGSNGNLPYICHAPRGRELLEYEGLPEHALVAERHIGVGISRQEIVTQQLPLPDRDFLPERVEEKIISWADLFFSKTPEKLWREKPIKEVRKHLAGFGKRQLNVFDEWLSLFGKE